MSGLRTPKRLRGVKKAAHNRAPKQEKEAAARLGGKVVKGSGCGFEKGDVRVSGVMRLEAKCTENKSFSVTRDMVRKIEEAALNCGEIPAMEIEFLPIEGHPRSRVALVPVYVLEMLVGSYGEDT